MSQDAYKVIANLMNQTFCARRVCL